LRIYLLVAISVLLTGSRSGLASFMAVSVFYLFSLDRKKILWVGSAIVGVLTYLVFIRGLSSFNAGRIDQIDRLKTFMGLLSFYDFRISEILRYPLGVGIYQKIPLGICNKMEGYADWFTGNYFNCDPIMLQSFVARALYQFGIYVLILIPILYLYELNKRMGWYMALLLLTPILLTSFSVGGFSNGLSFGGLALAILAYTQYQKYQRQGGSGPISLPDSQSPAVSL
jgi:O-Antigen ligase